MGVSLESASSADIANLDHMLTQLADFKTATEVTRMNMRVDSSKVGVVEAGKMEPTWGTSVAGVGAECAVCSVS